MNPDIADFIGKIGDLEGGMLAAQSSHFQAFRFGRRIFIFKDLDKGGQDAGLDVHVFLLFDCGFFQQFIAPEIRFDFAFPDKLTRRHSDNAAECAEEERVVIETGKFADLGQVVIPVTDQALRAVDLVLRAEVRNRGADQTVEQLRIIVFAVVEVCGNVLKRNLGRIDSADIVEHFFQEPVRLRLVRAGAGVTRNAEQREQPEDIRRKERGVVCIFRSHELGKDFLHFLILSGGEEARIYFFTGENCGQPVCQLLAGKLQKFVRIEDKGIKGSVWKIRQERSLMGFKRIDKQHISLGHWGGCTVNGKQDLSVGQPNHFRLAVQSKRAVAGNNFVQLRIGQGV